MLEIFDYDFMIRALLAGGLIGIMCPLIGSFLVVRRLSLVADTLAHVSLAGVATGMLIGVYPILTAMLFAFIGALFIEQLRKAYRTYGEISIAIVLSGGLAIAIVLIGLGKGFNLDVFSYLFGSIIAVSATDLQVMSGVAVAAILFVTIFYKRLFALSFDEEQAQLRGVSTAGLNALYMMMTALVVSVSIRVVGVLLVSSLIVIPVAAAMQIVRSFRNLVFAAVGIALTGIISGLVLSFHLDLAPGGTIVLMLLAVLIGAISLKKYLTA
ncbi:metal ABC transporter permease [Effusibacillus lacus]|uniref:Metal ABC transporter permease n=1 Tax=Effusibacillus lacus TaxID=1348429 RepID=A0A292YNB8_9BACL|nr:metal ABC transporter permease [Effusibacillus lacus]TCS71440.1 zinc transport system permease protein [Effusibacillus lacus]GAX89970.1 metal ABC transporter permease [Effusibacillus lacus]